MAAGVITITMPTKTIAKSAQPGMSHLRLDIPPPHLLAGLTIQVISRRGKGASGSLYLDDDLVTG
jgi:hypothetical protein